MTKSVLAQLRRGFQESSFEFFQIFTVEKCICLSRVKIRPEQAQNMLFFFKTRPALVRTMHFCACRIRTLQRRVMRVRRVCFIAIFYLCVPFIRLFSCFSTKNQNLRNSVSLYVSLQMHKTLPANQLTTMFYILCSAKKMDTESATYVPMCV